MTTISNEDRAHYFMRYGFGVDADNTANNPVMMTNEKIIEIAKLMHRANECTSVYAADAIRCKEELLSADKKNQDHQLIRAAYKVLAGEEEFVSSDDPGVITRAGLLARDLGATFESGDVGHAFIWLSELPESEVMSVGPISSIVLKPSRQAVALRADNARRIQTTPAIKKIEALVRSRGREPVTIRSDKPLTERRIMMCRGSDAANAGIAKNELPAGCLHNPDFMDAYEHTGTELLN
jgi:hypothetical protein